MTGSAIEALRRLRGPFDIYPSGSVKQGKRESEREGEGSWVHRVRDWADDGKR